MDRSVIVRHAVARSSRQGTGGEDHGVIAVGAFHAAERLAAMAYFRNSHVVPP